MKDRLNKKHILIIFALILSTKVFSLGIGFTGNFTPTLYENKTTLQSGIACSIKTDNIPLSFGIATDWNFTENYFSFYTSCDWWLFLAEVNPFITFFFGPGLAVETDFFDFFKSQNDFLLCPRFVTGLSHIFYDGFLETFFQVAFEPSFNLINANDFSFKVPCNVGIRFYF